MQVGPSPPGRRRPDPIAQSDLDEPGADADAPITVLLAADMDLLRSALVSLLSGEDDIEVVAAVKDTGALPQVALRLRPRVIVMDLPSTGGLATIRDLRTRLPQAQVVALTPVQPPGLIQRLLAADVRGAVDKNAPAARLLEAIRGAAHDRPVVDVHLAVAALAVAPNPLTPRELEVLRLTARGRPDGRSPSGCTCLPAPCATTCPI